MNRRGFMRALALAPIAAALPAVAGRAAIPPHAGNTGADGELIVDGAICPSCGSFEVCNCVTAKKLAAGSVSSDKIVANTITGDKIRAGSISIREIQVDTMSAISANIGMI